MTDETASTAPDTSAAWSLRALVIADAGLLADDLVAAVKAAGLRIVGPASLEYAALALDGDSAFDVIVADTRASEAGRIEPMLAAIEHAIERDGVKALVTITAEQIDAASVYLFDAATRFLCDPATGEIEANLREFLAPSLALRERDEEERRQLRDLAARALAVAQELQEIAAAEMETGGGTPVAEQSDQEIAARVRLAVRGRRLRSESFKGDLFADPAWDILLDLFAARLEGKHVSVSSLCVAAAVPPTTALRWITLMVNNGLLERQADDTDRRRSYIRLSDKACTAMRAYLAALARTGLSIP